MIKFLKQFFCAHINTTLQARTFVGDNFECEMQKKCDVCGKRLLIDFKERQMVTDDLYKIFLLRKNNQENNEKK